MFELQGTIMLAISAILFVVKGFALVDCVARQESRFPVTGGLSKSGWLILLVLAVLVHALFRSPLDLFNLIGTVAALVYLAQVRSGS